MTADAGGVAAVRARVLTPFVSGLLLVVVPTLVLGAAVCGLALAARDLAAAEYGRTAYEALDLSLAGHGLALVLLFWLLVVMTRSLWGGGGGRVVAVVVVLLTVVGPGSLAAVPAFTWTVDGTHAYDETGVVPWWAPALAVCWLALVLATSAWSLRLHPVAPTGSYLERGRLLLALLVVAGVQALALVVDGFWLDPGHSDLDLAMQLGWSALAAGLVTAAATTSSWVSRLAMVLLAPALVAQMYAAYTSQGGWPRVPGWEGGRAPLYSTVAVAVVVCAAPLVGWALGIAGHALEEALARRASRRTASEVPVT